MRSTTRTIVAALLVAGMLVVAGCAGPSATNNTTDGAANGTVTTVDPGDTPEANDSGADADAGDSEEGGYALVSAVPLG